MLSLSRPISGCQIIGFSTRNIVVAATSVIEPEEDEIELIPESPCIDAKLCEVRSSNCSLGSQPAGEARSVNWPNMLLERECAHGFLLSETVVGTSSMSRVLSVFTVLVEGAE